MRRNILATLGALAVVVAGTSAARAQTNTLNSFGGFPTPPAYNTGPGAYTVAPAMPGVGGTYSYVQQNTGAALGASPNAYYSANFFTATPMTSYAPNAYNSGYTGYAPATTYAPATGVPTYAAANQAYYANRSGYYGTNYTTTRRSGPFRRMFGR